MIKQYTMADLFCGIGGIRMGFENTGKFKTTFACDFDKQACETYASNFHCESPFGDITKLKTNNIPDVDIITAGFPCQAFSLLGKKKGFNDTRGTLFFDVARIIDEKRPKVVLLENVNNIKSHDDGNTFKRICEVLTNDLKYHVSYQTLKASDFRIPQSRSRIFMVCFRDPSAFSFPLPQKLNTTIQDLLENNVNPQYYLTTKAWDGLKRHKQIQHDKGNTFGYNIINPQTDIASTLTVSNYGREHNLLVDKSIKQILNVVSLDKDINSDYIRYLTKREYARLQGFPDSYHLPEARSSAYKQIGNSVAVPVITALANSIVNALN